jgi:hypothetical protein
LLTLLAVLNLTEETKSLNVMQHEHLSRRTRSRKEDKQLLQAIALFVVAAIFVSVLLIANI